ncbi:MAG TPA: methionyl-tRNA formyltransferase [Thermoanaerobaculales bacterium]|nr:methionyl-tRNA formyltransferase [Thermoanaerobaculales bacterium]HPA82562.1 methionyl-tRNA formyltransferase [Thermoanaerobaculales bacterium]HQL28948.1 methionyl-tRNA formyltransferase [Thermoanaerobaculales bacterium]HQN96000.1 methionyl-tRNA formyltransferase [Thermoanaerobaculales bacterium]HQP42840.1 methionyl-tRNA formyltransferase [Thermoanaerobaculales bacterium]
MRVVFFGTPEFAVPSLERLVASRHEVVRVVSRPDKPVGRQQVVTPPAVVEAALRHGIAAWQPASLKSEQAAAELTALAADAAVVVAYGRLIPEGLLAIPRHGFVNLHPSLLPRHRGPSPIQWALVCGDRRTGVTTMLLDKGLDTGPILLQRRVEIDPRDTAELLAPRLAELGAELLVETLDRLEAGSLTPRPQPEDGANLTPMLRREFGKVDWSMPARQLVNRLRGFTPWPGLYTAYRGSRLKVFGLEEVVPPPAGDEHPGSVLAADAAGVMVRCGRGSAARITEMQREGRRRLPADAFQIGERVSRGERFG